MCLAAEANAFAQQATPKRAVSASAIDAMLVRGSMPPEGNPSIPETGIGGHAFGVTFGLGFAVSPSMEFVAELSWSGVATDEQYSIKYLSSVKYRDTLLSGYVRFNPWPGGTVRFEPVVGGGVTFSDVQRAFGIRVGEPFEGYEDPYQDWPHGKVRPALSGGIDVTIGRGSVAFVPTVRVHYILRDGVTSDLIGLGAWSIRYGVGLRGSF